MEHLVSELARLDVLLKRELILARDATPQEQPDDLRGLVITEGEISSLAGEADYLRERWRRQERLATSLTPLDERERAIRKDIDERVAESEAAGVRLALPLLARRFELSAREIDLLLIAVAPEIEPRYETLYAYLQNDVTRRRPSIDLALNLLSRGLREKLTARRLLGPAATLVADRLVVHGEEPHDRQPSFPRRFLKPDDDVVAALLGWLPRTLASGEYEAPLAAGAPPDVDPPIAARLDNLVAQLRGVQGRAVVRVVGTPATLLDATARWIGAQLGQPLLAAELTAAHRDAERAARLVRDARIHGCALVVRAPDALDEEGARGLADAETVLGRALERFPGLALLLGDALAFRRLPDTASIWRVDVRAPGFERRRRHWAEALGSGAAREEIGRLADAFRFPRERVTQTVSLATSFARLRDPDSARPALRDLFDAGRVLSTPDLGRYAVRVEPRASWGDIVLPRERCDQLRRLASWIVFRHQVHEGWGFGRKLSRGKGLNVLFTGPSGTGKTMAAEVLAGEVSMELYQIDLSSVVSKYIGETEKHLSAIFREAQESQAVLFFDEADALFGKRTEVKDAHDRYANIEINFLLQRVEQYEGIVILASNMQRNLDEAFLRRLHDVVEFPFPDEALRERLWRAHVPAEADCAPDIDFGFLAQQFKLTGGSIRNIVIDAAFRAAAESQPIGMTHLILATKSELQKQGKLPTKAEFGPYYELIQPVPPPARLVGH